ncbi:hypothetical protein [Cellulomonas soli]
MRWFAQHQPFTPIIETTRDLLSGTALTTSTTVQALGWSVLVGALGYAWSRSLYRRERS